MKQQLERLDVEVLPEVVRRQNLPQLPAAAHELVDRGEHQGLCDEVKHLEKPLDVSFYRTLLGGFRVAFALKSQKKW